MMEGRMSDAAERGKWRTAVQAMAILWAMMAVMIMGISVDAAPQTVWLPPANIAMPAPPPPKPKPKPQQQKPKPKPAPPPKPKPKPAPPPKPAADAEIALKALKEETERLAEERRKKEERRREKEKEAARKEEERKEREKLEQQRKIEEEQKREEEERKRKEEEEKREREEREKKAREEREAQEQKRRETLAMLQAEAAAEEARVASAYQNALGVIVQQIRRNLTTPQGLPNSAVVRVRIVLDSDGGLQEPPQILDPSGYDEYDQRAYRAVLQALPLYVPENEPEVLRRLTAEEIILNISPEF